MICSVTSGQVESNFHLTYDQMYVYNGGKAVSGDVTSQGELWVFSQGDCDSVHVHNGGSALTLSGNSEKGNSEIPSSLREIQICWSPLLATRIGTGSSRLYAKI